MSVRPAPVVPAGRPIWARGAGSGTGSREALAWQDLLAGSKRSAVRLLLFHVGLPHQRGRKPLGTRRKHLETLRTLWRGHGATAWQGGCPQMAAQVKPVVNGGQEGSPGWSHGRGWDAVPAVTWLPSSS